MSEIKLRVVEARELQKELFGFRNDKGETVLKGFLAQDLKAITKFKLVQFGKQIQENETAVEEQRKALIEKYGTVQIVDGQEVKAVQQFKKDKKGENTAEYADEFLAFIREFEEVMAAKVTLKVDKLHMSDLDFKTDEVYPFIFEHLVEAETE